MKKIPVIVIAVVGLMLSAYAEAATPKRRSRNANRIGPYAGALLGSNTYTDNQDAAEQDLEDAFVGIPTTDLAISTKDNDVGFQALFGYRFNRYLAAEFELVSYGDLRSTAHANIDFEDGTGSHPASIGLDFHTGGPQLSVLGILPLGTSFELFGKAGMLFASSTREFVIKVDGQTNSFGSVKGDSTEVILGIGAAYHVNQMYTIRAQFERVNDVGEKNRTDTENIDVASLGLIVRF